MNNKRSALLISTVVLSVGLMGCQGQNPFKRQSNPAPASKYPNVSAPENQNKYIPGHTHVAPSTSSKTEISSEKEQEDAPIVKFIGLKEKVNFGESFNFKIQIEDFTSTDKLVPVLEKINFSLGKNSGDLDAGDTIDCNTLGRKISKTKFEFDCNFDSNLTKNVDKLLNSGKEAKAVFQVSALSTASRLKSKNTEGIVTVKFEKVKTDKADKSDKAEKTEKTEISEKTEKSDAVTTPPVVNKEAKADKLEVKKQAKPAAKGAKS